MNMKFQIGDALITTEILTIFKYTWEEIGHVINSNLINWTYEHHTSGRFEYVRKFYRSGQENYIFKKDGYYAIFEKEELNEYLKSVEKMVICTKTRRLNNINKLLDIDDV